MNKFFNGITMIYRIFLISIIASCIMMVSITMATPDTSNVVLSIDNPGIVPSENDYHITFHEAVGMSEGINGFFVTIDPDTTVDDMIDPSSILVSVNGGPSTPVTNLLAVIHNPDPNYSQYNFQDGTTTLKFMIPVNIPFNSNVRIDIVGGLENEGPSPPNGYMVWLNHDGEAHPTPSNGVNLDVQIDAGVNTTSGTQKLSTVTSIDNIGIVIETDKMAWMVTNNPSGGGNSQLGPYGSVRSELTGGGRTAFMQRSSGDPQTGALYSGQVKYTTAYNAQIIGQTGNTVFTKIMDVDTGDKVIGQSNLNAQTILSFVATGSGGKVVGSENILMDGVGNTTTVSDMILCPFSSVGGNVIPAFCNIVQTGNTYDLTLGSVASSVNERVVGTDATTPVVLSCNINIRPYNASEGLIPATGSAMAYIKAHIQEARDWDVTNAEDLTYSEVSSAQGSITSFKKAITYQSGMSRQS